jgi:uncharacterized protein YndB with AHSA1/START domain
VGFVGSALGGVRMHAIMENVALGQVAAQRRRLLSVAPAPTGRRVVRDGQEWLVHTRHVRAGSDSVWRALTRPERLDQWVGSWRPRADGTVEFLLGFEGDDVLPIVYRVDAVAPGRSFSVSVPDPDGVDPSHVTVELTPAGVGAAAGTLVTLAHSVGDRALAPYLATGGEYYLDRLVGLLEEWRSPHLADFDEYFVRQAAHYRRLFPTQRDGRLLG